MDSSSRGLHVSTTLPAGKSGFYPVPRCACAVRVAVIVPCADCLSVHYYSRATGYIMQIMNDINSISVTCVQNPEAAAFKHKKLAVSLTKLPGPTHQPALCMRIHVLTVPRSGRYGIKCKQHRGGF